MSSSLSWCRKSCSGSDICLPFVFSFALGLIFFLWFRLKHTVSVDVELRNFGGGTGRTRALHLRCTNRDIAPPVACFWIPLSPSCHHAPSDNRASSDVDTLEIFNYYFIWNLCSLVRMAQRAPHYWWSLIYSRQLERDTATGYLDISVFP